MKELYVCVTLTLVLAGSFVTDTIGIHALFGAFVVAIVTPKEDLYFASSALKNRCNNDQRSTIVGTSTSCHTHHLFREDWRNRCGLAALQGSFQRSHVAWNPYGHQSFSRDYRSKHRQGPEGAE